MTKRRYTSSKSMDAKRVASFLIQYFNSVGDPISNLKLQKMLYYIQVWYKVYFHGNLIFSDIPEAWVHGPVYPEIYNIYKSFNGGPIIPSCGFSDAEINKEKKDIFRTKEEQAFIDSVLSFYGSKSGFMLELMTHSEEPWKSARVGLSAIKPSHRKIDLNSAQVYYSNLLAQQAKVELV